MKKIVVVGAGISGLFFANLLKQDPEYEILIFEKNSCYRWWNFRVVYCKLV